MKVISGILKGRTILGYNIDGTRPTMDRVKESIFAMIQDNIKDSIVLDLFSGSGNYGIESISLGSKLVYFNDRNKECVNIINKNINNFNIKDKSIILNMDYLKCLKYLNINKNKFDLVFLDPPYKEHIIENVLIYLVDNHLLNDNALIICEFMKDKLNDKYNNLEVIKARKYGEKEVFIYKYKGDKDE